MTHRRQTRARRSENFVSSQAEISQQANWPFVVAGGALALLGLRKITSIQGLALTAVGGAMVYQGLGCAHCDSQHFDESKLSDNSERPDSSDERDPIDEASWESFPASDSPSFSPGRA